MSSKLVIELPRAMPAASGCLPHAAMSLGQQPGLKLDAPTLVSRLVIQEQAGNWVLYRMDAHGGFVGDTWHPTKADALAQAQKEFDVEVADEELPEDHPHG